MKHIIKISIFLVSIFVLSSCETSLEEENFFTGDQAATEQSTETEISYPDFFPDYDWARVPVCIHISNSTNFTEDEAKFLSQFPLICLEKGTGRYYEDGETFQGSDIGVEIAAAAIKSHNKETKVLCYQSFKTDYGEMYTTGSILNPESFNPNENANADWALKYSSGEYVLTSSQYRVYDQRNSDARAWWVNNLVSWTNKPNIDGVFIDGYSYIPSETGTIKNYGEGVYADWYAGNEAKRNMIKEQVTSRKITLGNCVDSSDDEEDIEDSFMKLESVGGGMMEHFCILGGDQDDEIARAIQTIRDVGREGKMIVVKGWPRYNLTDNIKHLSTEYMEEISKQDIVFPLAAFLCGAGKYAYFCYSWHYGYSQGSHILYDEYTKPLGKPKGEYKKDGYVFTREFEHASVWVDIANREAKINWDN